MPLTEEKFKNVVLHYFFDLLNWVYELNVEIWFLKKLQWLSLSSFWQINIGPLDQMHTQDQGEVERKEVQ